MMGKMMEGCLGLWWKNCESIWFMSSLNWWILKLVPKKSLSMRVGISKESLFIDGVQKNSKLL